MRILVLALLLCSCGPPPDPPGRYHGEVTDHEGRPRRCTLEITPTGPDRVYLHLAYGTRCDGDGAVVLGEVLIPDAGGEIVFDGDMLRGNFFSATGNEYLIDATPAGAQ